MSGRKLGILANLEKSGVREVYDRVSDWAVKQEYDIVSNVNFADADGAIPKHNPFGVEDQNALKKQIAETELLITMGGDGTLLYAAPMAAEAAIPVLSVNLGSLGFHTQVSPHNLNECLEAVAAGECEIENRMMLKVELPNAEGESEALLALNDFVISKSAWGHMVTLRLAIDDQVVSDISADALIVSSPTGSSAYNYAAGGPVLFPDMDAFILNALCAHRMRVSPLVIPGEAKIEIGLRARRAGESAQILADGQPWQSIADEETLKISMAPMYLPLMVFENDFYGKLRNKLRWGGLF